jgi:FKBP-type peptidyl-prolyl cis-trans isomerase
MTDKPKTRRGFAAMKPETQQAIAGAGGKVAHEQGKAHTYNRDEARAAAHKRASLQQRVKELEATLKQLRALTPHEFKALQSARDLQYSGIHDGGRRAPGAIPEAVINALHERGLLELNPDRRFFWRLTDEGKRLIGDYQDEE